MIFLLYFTIIVIAFSTFLGYCFYFNLFFIEITGRNLQGAWWFILPSLVLMAVVAVLYYAIFGTN